MFDACFTLCPPCFAISLMGKRKPVALAYQSYLPGTFKIIVTWLFLAVSWVSLQYVIVVSSGHTHLLYRGNFHSTIQTIFEFRHFLMEMFLALLPMVYIFLSLFVLLECALMLMTSTTETYF